MAELATWVLFLSSRLHTVSFAPRAGVVRIEGAGRSNHRCRHLHGVVYRHDPGASIVSCASKTRPHLSPRRSHGAAGFSAPAHFSRGSYRWHFLVARAPAGEAWSVGAWSVRASRSATLTRSDARY